MIEHFCAMLHIVEKRPDSSRPSRRVVSLKVRDFWYFTLLSKKHEIK
jgi:hypothetical protein